MQELDIEVHSLVCKIQNGEPVVIRFTLDRTRQAELCELISTYTDQAYCFIEAAGKTDNLRSKAKLFSKGAFAMRQAASAKWWQNTLTKKDKSSIKVR